MEDTCEYCGHILETRLEPDVSDRGGSYEVAECSNDNCPHSYESCPYCIDGLLDPLTPDEFECNECGRYFDPELELIAGQELLTREDLNNWVEKASKKDNPLEFLRSPLFVSSLVFYMTDSTGAKSS